MLNYLTLKPETFGLDISDFSLKIIKLKKKKNKFELVSYGETKIKPGIIEKGKIKNEKLLAATIKMALSNVKGEKLKTKYVIASLPEEECFLQIIQLPMMKKEEVKKAIYFEAENYIPLPIEEVYLDFHIISPDQNNLEYLNVLTIALPKEVIDPYLNSLKEAGLQPLALEIEAQAICRALIKREISQEHFLLVDFGETRTTFIIFSEGSLKFTASHSISSKRLTEVISNNLKISFDKAEELKIKYGIDNSEEGRRNFEILKPILSEFVEQIEKYLNYYQTHFVRKNILLENKNIEKLLLCGGGINLKGFSNFLISKLEIEVSSGISWTNLLLKNKKTTLNISYQKSLSYTIALGLALRDQKL